ncbi:hypothetical protein [Modestobacter sp. NPDC049651]|uniref:hypothetical protein n=1 Tax=unclassified Modestobacter TaxID=2643866 RepID=UPI0033FD8B8E
MEPRDEQPGGDYGYDEVHRDVQPAGGPAQPTPSGAAPPTRPEDQGDDYGYDEAHSF